MRAEIDNIQSRIRQIPKFFNETLKDFLQNIGYSARILVTEKGVGMDVIEKILTLYPTLSFKWLLTGEGVPVMPSEKEVATELKDCQTEKTALNKEISALKRDRRAARREAKNYTE